MARGLELETLYFKEVESTHSLLIEKLQNRELTSPVALWSEKQTSGIGSRTSSWIGEDGNIFLSFSIPKNRLPEDLPIHSASIYFSWLLLKVLREKGSRVWLKWPNDFYLDRKIGGTITTLKGDSFIVGIGLNSSSSRDFQSLDIDVDNSEVVEKYLKSIEKDVSWRDVFGEYSQEFYKSADYSVHSGEKKLPLKDASLYGDGSIKVNGERIYNSR
jgi:BirA family biotin operon repressor/biotin-[acetyl-CoA-carboxylase] ligase